MSMTLLTTLQHPTCYLDASCRTSTIDQRKQTMRSASRKARCPRAARSFTTSLSLTMKRAVRVGTRMRTLCGSSSVDTPSRPRRPTWRKCGFPDVTVVCIQQFDADHITLTLIRSCSDVGGGSIENGARYSLARISLRWMIRECFKANSGILFHGSMFNEIGLDPATLYPHIIDRPAVVYGDASDMDVEQLKPDATVIQCDPRGTFESEKLEDLSDALCPVYDQLRIGLHWWILELIPQKRKYQKEDGTWAKNIGYVARFTFWTLLYRQSSECSSVSTSVGDVPSQGVCRTPKSRYIGRSRYEWKQMGCQEASISLKRSSRSSLCGLTRINVELLSSPPCQSTSTTLPTHSLHASLHMITHVQFTPPCLIDRNHLY